MRPGATISGSMHAVLLALAFFGADWFQDRTPVPLNVTEIEMIDGAKLEARLSTAPVVQSEGPAELSPPAPGESTPSPETPTETADAPSAAEMPTPSEPPSPRPDAPDVDMPPPPVDIPSEAPVPTIAEIPSPDPLPEQAPRPESPESTEVVTPVASAAPPSPHPEPPKAQEAPEPEPEPQPVAETVPQPEAPEPVEPEPQKSPEPAEETEIAAADPNAPEGLAPRQARLPVARPADLARAAPASSRPEPAPQEPAEEEKTEEPARQVATAEPEQAEKPEQAEPAGGSSRPTAPLSRGEKNALRLGIKKYYTYSGDRSDPNLQVAIRVELTEQGTIRGNPVVVDASGGTAASQAALGRAGRAALIYADNAGEFGKLPPEKYGAWRVLTVVFTTRNEVLF